MLLIRIEVCPLRLIVGQLLHHFKIYCICPCRRKLEKKIKKKERKKERKAGPSVSAHRFEPGIFQILVRIDTTQYVSHFDAVVPSESLKDVVKTEATVRSFVCLYPVDFFTRPRRAYADSCYNES